MTRQEMEWALFGLSREGAPGGGDAEAMRRDIMAEFDRMRQVYDAAMAYVRHVRCRGNGGSYGLIAKHYALLVAGEKVMTAEEN